MEDEGGEKLTEDDSVELQDDSVPDEDEIPTKNSEKVSSDKKQSEDKNDRMAGQRVDEGGDTEMCVEVDGDKVETLGAARGSETTFHTALDDIASDATQLQLMSAEDYHTMRSQLEIQLATWSQVSMKGDFHSEYTFVYNECFIDDTSGIQVFCYHETLIVLKSQISGDVVQ